MLISSYDGGHALMPPLAKPLSPVLRRVFGGVLNSAKELSLKFAVCTCVCIECCLLLLVPCICLLLHYASVRCFVSKSTVASGDFVVAIVLITFRIDHINSFVLF